MHVAQHHGQRQQPPSPAPTSQHGGSCFVHDANSGRTELTWRPAAPSLWLRSGAVHKSPPTLYCSVDPIPGHIKAVCTLCHPKIMCLGFTGSQCYYKFLIWSYHTLGMDLEKGAASVTCPGSTNARKPSARPLPKPEDPGKGLEAWDRTLFHEENTAWMPQYNSCPAAQGSTNTLQSYHQRNSGRSSGIRISSL